MSTMQQVFSQYFDNGASDESFEKEAQVELFAKLAAQNGIDLEQLSEGQISELWDATFSKEAAEEEKEEEKDEKVEAAKAEHDKKKEAAAKIAEAEYLGQVMAQSLISELNKEAGMKDSLKNLGEYAKGKADKAGKAVGKHLESVGKKTTALVARTGGAEAAMDPRTARRIGAGAYGAGAAAAGGAGYGAKKLMDKEKKSSALDELAFESAVEKAASAGWDADEASDRIGAVLTLGVEESVKVAYAQDLGSAVDVRSLELLEAAGYPVTWNE